MLRKKDGSREQASLPSDPAPMPVANGPAGLLILRLLRDRITANLPVGGGSLASSSGDTTLAFPAGAFTDTVTLTYRHLLADQDTGSLAGIGRTFEVTAVYSDTRRPAQSCTSGVSAPE